MKKNSIWFLGGLSGGHLYPLITLYKNKLKKNKKGIIYHFFVPKNSLIEAIINAHQDSIFQLSVLKYPKPIKNFKLFLFFYYSILIFFKIFYLCIFEKPSKIYSTGGYFSLPFSLCAFLCNIPFHIYHLDVIPGLAGKIIGVLKAKQCIIHSETKKYLLSQKNITLVKYPIRYNHSDIKNKNYIKNKLNLSAYFVILILGGSQGSNEINNLILSIVPILLHKNIYLIHQTGNKNNHELENIYQKNNIQYTVFSYSDHLVDYYNSSDLIISRAGAGTLAEIDFFKKKAIIIPLQNVAHNHQIKNAESYSKKNKRITLILDINTFKNYITECLHMKYNS